MLNAHDVLFRALADPTRRPLFERLCRKGEQTVGALTALAGVSQPAVSKHLGILKQAGLVRDRHQRRQTHYRAAPEIWRALPAAPGRGVADEERCQTGGGASTFGRTGGSIDCKVLAGRAELDAVL